MKIRPVVAKLLHADRRTDKHDGANSSFSKFCERVWQTYFIGATVNNTLRSADLTVAQAYELNPVLYCNGGHENDDNNIKMDLSSV